MLRRQFLTQAAGALALAHAAPGPLATATAGDFFTRKPRGVNLGGWLVLEKWMVPSVFRGTTAPDEYELCRTLGPEASKRLEAHRNNFITAADFSWLKARGVDAVRLPVGYWVLESPPPYVSATRHLDFAFEQARRNGLRVLLDLHGAPGSQNGWDHSGRGGTLAWHTDRRNVEATLRVLEALAQRYGRNPALWGIELLNEPRWDVPMGILKTFYQDAYHRIRPHINPQAVVVLHDAFRPFEWKNFMTEPHFSNVMLDTHLYQAYTDEDRHRGPAQQVAFALERAHLLDNMSGQLWTMVGEWSLALPPETWRGQSSFQIAATKIPCGAAQLLSYESSHGWFYWSYKTEDQGDWNFRYCVDHGLMPANFADAAQSRMAQPVGPPDRPASS